MGRSETIYTRFVLLFACAWTGDIITTTIGYLQIGPRHEFNPILRTFLQVNLYLAMALKIAGTLLAVVLLYVAREHIMAVRGWRYWSVMVTITGFGVTINNALVVIIAHGI